MSAIAVSCTVCGNQEVVGSNPIATLLGVVAQLAETTDDKDVDVDELIGSNVDSIPLMYYPTPTIRFKGH